MEHIDLKSKIFSKREAIKATGNAKNTGTVGIPGVGMSKHRPSGVTGATKYNGAAKVIDYILVDKIVNALESDDSVYGEVSLDGEVYRFIAKEKSVDYVGKRLHSFYGVIPEVLYELRSASKHDELKMAFSKVQEDLSSKGVAVSANLLLFCDSFYYDGAKNIDDYIVNENALQPETIDAAIRTGLLGEMPIISTIPDIPKLTVSTEKQKVEKKEVVNKDETYDNIKAGKNIVVYDWNEKQKEKIPSLKTLDNFIPVPTFFSMERKIEKHMNNVILRLDSGINGIDAIGNDYVNISIAGKPGTGKTTIAYALGAATGMPVYTVPLTKNTEEDHLQGLTKVVDGKWSNVETDFAYAYEHGGIIVLEEINLADPAVVMGAIGQAIEFPFVFMKDGYKPVNRHPLCIIISTMNIGTFGSKGVNQALSSRFKQTYILNDPKKEDFIEILKKSGNKVKECKWVYNAYEKLIAYLCSPSVNAEEICLNVTLRGCLGALENISEGEEAKEAIRNTLIGKIAEADLGIAEKAYDEIVNLPEM